MDNTFRAALFTILISHLGSYIYLTLPIENNNLNWPKLSDANYV